MHLFDWRHAGLAEGFPEGITAVKVKPQSKDSPLEEVYSGWHFRSKETKALQADDIENPGIPLGRAGRGVVEQG